MLVLIACPKGAETATSGSQTDAGDTWVIFEVYQAGTGNSLGATVWPASQPDHFETLVEGEAGADVRFYGLGRTDEGYSLAFEAGRKAELRIWTPGHELHAFSVKLKRGENRVITELKVAEVEDDRVPERIRIEVLQSLPSQGPKSGS
jgi:hypothetical protein